jgi:hypothetical protein
MCTLIVAAKMNDVDPQAWVADVLSRIADHPVHRLDDLLPWNCAAERERRKLAAPLSFASKSRSTTWSPRFCVGSRFSSTSSATGCI